MSGATVVWSSSALSVATVNGQGLVTAVGNGSATVTARSGSASASISVTVMQSAGSILIEPSMAATLMSLGETLQLTATVLDGNGQAVSGAEVTWSSSDEAVATVSGHGLVTAVGNGSVTITARSGTASASIPVSVMQSAGSIVIEPSMATLMSLGETIQLSASVLDHNGQPVANANVEWSTSDEAVAAVSGQGLVTAVANGSATITARSGSASASVPVSVMQSAGSIVIEPSSTTLMSLGETVQLIASVLDGNGQQVSGAVVEWSSSDASVATVSAQGLVTAVGNGSVTITARSGNASASIPVSVMQSAGNIVIEPSSATLMSLGETVQLSASVLDGNGQPVSGATVVWSSSDASVATVSGQGLVTAVGNGSATVTARSGNASASISVTVMQSAGSIVIEPSMAATLMSLGETLQLTATVLDGNGQPVSDATIEWSSSDASVAMVSSQGLVTAVANGSATITARAGDITADVEVTFRDTSRDRDALIALYHATDGPNWHNNESWLSDAPLGEWWGVTTDITGQVTDLSLDDNGLSGAIPPEIGELEHLTELNFWHNALSGPIPSELGDLGNLEKLGLGNNALTGPIPPELGNLSNLKDVRLVRNRLTGPIPSALGKLQNLTVLSLWANALSGPIPPDLGILQNLSSLSLGANALSGPIPPEIARLRKLNILELEATLLSGPIPPQLGALQNLEELLLNSNPNLTGPLPDTFLNLKLDSFSISGSNLCVPSTTAFRRWLSNVPDRNISGFCPDSERDPLVALYNYTDGPDWTVSTNWLSDLPLGEWHGVTVDETGRVTGISLVENNLAGTIPYQLGDLASLEGLDLSKNSGLSGLLPRSLIGLDPNLLLLGETQVCAPPDFEFTEWLGRILQVDVVVCTDTRQDYYALAALYHSTNGMSWTNSSHWLSEEPLGAWHGVTVDANGMVTEVRMRNNNLRGPIPPELGQLAHLTTLDLARNALSGPVPPELGQLDNLRLLQLGVNSLTGSIPPEFGQLENLERLALSYNSLTGFIPSELSQLQNLVELLLGDNSLIGSIPPELAELEDLYWIGLEDNLLTGPIPPELARLQNLTVLELGQNTLSGAIPLELGQLENLRNLDLRANVLTGSITPELAGLENLEWIDLGYNLLTGPIPPELARLQKLSELELGYNRLSGPIPPELGQLQNLTVLSLERNTLTGPIPPEIERLEMLTLLNLGYNELTDFIPPELGNLSTLEVLDLSSNRLTGNVPRTFGDLGNLRHLYLTGNQDMSGTLPSTLIDLNLESLALGGTGLCAAPEPDIQDWLLTIAESRVPTCSTVGTVAAYLTQAVQSLAHPVPLVAGEDALLRVFVTAPNGEEILMPAVRAAFFQDGAEVHSVDIPGGDASVPREIEEGNLSGSANATVPGSIITPGLEMIVEIDPGEASDPGWGVDGRLPPSGRMAMDVRDVPTLDLTLVPLLWTEDPDRSILTQVEDLTADSDLFRLTRDIMPVRDFHLTVREPVWTSLNPIFENYDHLLQQVEMIHTMDGAAGHYMGVLKDDGGVAQFGGRVSLVYLNPKIVAHELGHNFGLDHAPCNVLDVDPSFPYADGSIGAWGYDLLEETLVRPDTPDVMGYCFPNWISDYHFTKALAYRDLQEQALLAAASAPSTRGLLLWGGVDDGELVLNPAFAVDAPASPPRLNGPYRVTGEEQNGRTLFSLTFGMPRIADLEDEGSSFAFVLPVRPDWPGRLSRITLTGPDGVATLSGEDSAYDEEAPTTALLLDPGTGKVRGILRDWPGPSTSRQAARRALPEPGLDVVISNGIPDPSDW